jgi:two-component system chemotaxis response regulator CheY
MSENEHDLSGQQGLEDEPSLLIVDDASMMRLKIERLATSAGWKRISQTGDGAEAAELYREHPYNLVTMDIVMAGIGGLETLKRIRQIDPQARVVMVSAINQKSTLSNCIDAGAMDFIVKPFDSTRFEKFLTDQYQAARHD